MTAGSWTAVRAKAVVSRLVAHGCGRVPHQAGASSSRIASRPADVVASTSAQITTVDQRRASMGVSVCNIDRFGP